MLLKLCGLDEALYGGKPKPAMADLVGYGGAAFGGKTEGMVGLALIALSTIPGVKIGYFRRTFKELEQSDGPIDRTHSLFPKIGATYNDSKHLWTVGDADDEDWNKGDAPAMRFCHLQFEKDIWLYQSAAFDIELWDEATHFSWMQFRYLISRNRKSKASKIPRAFALACSNPGNIGHIWYKKIYGIKDKLREDYE